MFISILSSCILVATKLRRLPRQCDLGRNRYLSQTMKKFKQVTQTNARWNRARAVVYHYYAR
ncbi:MAG: hypothetical protein WCP07_09365 [bacterium]